MRVTVQRWRCVSDTMSGFSREERAAPFTLEYRVFLSEWWRRVARPPIHSKSLGASGRAGGRVVGPARAAIPVPIAIALSICPNVGHVGKETTESP